MERELWLPLYRLAMFLGSRMGGWRYSTGMIVSVYLWAAVHDRSMTWALDPRHWQEDLRPKRLPSQPTLSKRMRRPDAQGLMTKIENTLVALLGLGRGLFRMIDGKPLTVSGVSKDPDAGYGRGAGQKSKGYKLHAIWDDGPLPLAWGLAAMNYSEKRMARELIPGLPGEGYLLGDGEFDANPLYDLAHAAGYQLVARKRRGKGLGHRRQSPHRLRSIDLLAGKFGQSIYQYRAAIERSFSGLVASSGGLICLPSWVRRFTRVRNWVHAKLLINAIRWCRHSNRAILALE